MVNFVAHLLVTAALLLLISDLVRRFDVRDATSAVVAALVLGLANAFVRPLALVLTLPLTLLTFGLFLLVVNGFVLKVVAALVPGFDIEGVMPAVWGALLLSVFNVIVEMAFGPAW